MSPERGRDTGVSRCRRGCRQAQGAVAAFVTDGDRSRAAPGAAPARSPALTCVYPQVDLEVVGRPEGLPTVRTVLQGRAQAPVAEQGGRRHPSGPPRLLADVCGEETFAHHFSTCHKLFAPKLLTSHKVKHVNTTPVYFIL